MSSDASSVTKVDGDLFHRGGTWAIGTTEKGGLASQAQSSAASGGQGLTSERQINWMVKRILWRLLIEWGVNYRVIPLL